jgi:hypothetical protein
LTRTTSRGICASRRITPSARPEIDDDVAELDALDDAGDDLALAVLELFVLALALGVADLLEDDLLGGLRGDAAELDRGQRIDDIVADHGARLQLLGTLTSTWVK